MRYLLCLVVLLLVSGVFGQADNQSWSSFTFKINVNDKSHVIIKPIIRHFDNISTYQNSSIDVAYSRKLGAGFSGQFLARQWFLPNDDKRTFWWIDLAHNLSINAGSISNRLRYHHSIDIDDIPSEDFIRYMLTYTPKLDWAIQPFIAIEPWFRVNDSNRFERIRYEPGISWAFEDGYSLKFVFRREETLNLDPGSKQNQFVLNMTKVLYPKQRNK